MAGRKQHYIPQALQRGFEASKSGKHSQVWVFRKGQAPYLSSTEGVGAQRHFYSEPSPGEVTLDDLITDYEKDVLSPAIEALRDMDLGVVAPEMAASVVSHLSIRAAFLRGSFTEIAKEYLTRMSQALANQESARAVMGIDSAAPESILVKSIDEELAKSLAMLPEQARTRLGRMVKFRVREHFATDFQNISALASEHMALASGVIPGAIQSGHNKVLEKELVPAQRTEKLKALQWRLVQAPQSMHVVLPDCLALATAKADFSGLAPYTLADDDALAGVLMPVSSTRALVGSQGDVAIDWSTLNLVLAEGSLDFFISSRSDPETAALAEHIGLTVSDFSRKLVEEDAFDAPAGSRPDDKGATAGRAAPQTPVVQFEPPGLGSEALEVALQAQLREPELAAYLTRLRALVVTPDVAAALTQRGATLNDYGKQQVQFGTCHGNFTPDGFVCEVFVPVDLAQLLCSSEPSHSRTASALIRHHLGRAAYMHFFARSVSAEEIQAPRGQLENFLLATAQLAASHYFGARLSAPNTMVADEFRYADAIPAQSLRWSFEGLARAREQFLAEPDVNKLLPALAVCVETLLATAATATVLSAVNPQMWKEGECAKVLGAAGLASWFSLLARDMNAYFVSREIWSGLVELEFLATHAERVLWGFGFYLSPASNQVRVDVASEQELAMVSNLLSGASFSAPA